MDNKKLLTELLEQPGKVRSEHIAMLQEMVQQYPYAQPIHMLLAKADAAFVAKAALYSNGSALYKVLQSSLIEEESTAEEVLEKTTDDRAVVAETHWDEQEVFEEVGELSEGFVYEPKQEVEAEILQPETVEENTDEQDEQEVFEEISELNSTFVEDANQVETAEDLPEEEAIEVNNTAEEELFIESVASSDFFVFEEKTGGPQAELAPEIETVIPDDPEKNFVSKYNDDKLPYSFLWWLDKTRKEHEQVFQPYAQPAPVAAKQELVAKTEFQQQYVEHIFHIQTPFEVADHLAEYPEGKIKDAKGAEIIERFLKEDPTIKPPKAELIDNENKAKRSSEDNYDLVSETLAKIYIEQMLYHKAIDTYKKLSLKFPEKSAYFADLIQSIEKKF
ncbi:hypothetical protein [Pedobacter sp. MW01-1-1]|uniref:hypothetical protein n=1 Tax=Pedobacter sp. MW01-1-1 TaxID=3383027 RepID=UPI003FEDF8AA